MASLTSHCLWRLLPILALQGWLSLVIPSVSAQIVPDQTLGAESSRVRTVNNSHQVIEGGANRGSHLFHSFDVFNIGAGRAAYFASPPGTLNIFSRVTGNDVSDIFGTLGVDGTANLYLLNPNGIVFGPNARLDVSGSFVASTANRLVFDDGQFFGAFPTNQPPLLQINVTPGLQYGNNLNATISNQGHLQVGQNLTLGAQRLELAGSLEAERDIVLQGWSRDLSNADYTVGGYVFTENLGGQGVDLLIPHENVVLANGDVQFTQTYEGESLYVLAGGQVSQTGIRAITITGTSGGSTTEQIADGIGGTQSVTVTAGDQPTVDIRSGVNWLALTGELPGNSNLGGAAVTFGIATGNGIELGKITNNGGNISLWSAGTISTSYLNTSSSIFLMNEDVTGRNGGDISLIAGEDIIADSINAYSASGSYSSSEWSVYSSSGNVTGGDGGDISLIAGEDINIGFVDSNSSASSSSFSEWATYSSSGDVIGGNGGNISLVAEENINVISVSSASHSSSFSYLEGSSQSSSGDVVGGNGGVLSLIARDNINVDSVYFHSSSSSSSTSDWFPKLSSGDAVSGNGGVLSLLAGENINVGSVYSSSSSYTSLGNVMGGNGGNLILVARKNANIGSIFLNSSSSTFVGDVVGGNGGNLSLIAGENVNVTSINLSSDARSFSSLPSSGASGNITGGNGGALSLVAGGNMSVGSIDSSSDAYSFSDVTWDLYWYSSSGDVIGGNGGNISLFAEEDINVDAINSSSFSSSFSFSSLVSLSGDVTGGNGGALSLVAGNDINVDSIYSFSSADSSSDAFTFPSSSSSPSSLPGDVTGGNGGAVSLIAKEDINLYLIHSFSSSVSISDLFPFIPSNSYLNLGRIVGGDGGDISVAANTGRILGARNSTIFSFSMADEGESGDGGNVILTAATQVDDLEILTLSSSAQPGTIEIVGLSNNFNILNISAVTNETVEIKNIFRGTIPTLVGGDGQSGDVNISSSGDITIRNSSFASEANSTIDAGDITITSPGLVTFNNSFIDTNTYSSGQAGSVTFNAQDLVIQDGSAIATHTSSSGNGGDIKFNVSNRLDINDATILASTEAGSTGHGGDINVDPTTTLIRNGGNIAVNAVGQGQGGNISITSDDLFLDQGSITAETLTGFGGNIELNIQDLLFMEHSSFISTSAGTAQTGGDGGNITINMPNGFLIAPYGADSDIVAHAAGGTGGNIDITAQGIYGFVEQPAIRGNGLNDIDASSEFSHNQMVSFDDLLVDPNQDSPASLANVLATGQLISPSCQVSSHLREDLALSSRDRIVEAQGWGRNANGQLMLQADVPNISAKQTKLFAASCQSNR